MTSFSQSVWFIWACSRFAWLKFDYDISPSTGHERLLWTSMIRLKEVGPHSQVDAKMIAEAVGSILYLRTVTIFTTYKQIKLGPWWWSSGQCTWLLLRRSEFESRWRLQFFLLNLCLKRTKINKKSPGLDHLFKKRGCLLTCWWVAVWRFRFELPSDACRPFRTPQRWTDRCLEICGFRHAETRSPTRDGMEDSDEPENPGLD